MTDPSREASPLRSSRLQPGGGEEKSTGNSGPIFVVGAGRSGTTLMRVILDSHPRICCGPELKVLSSIANQYQLFTSQALRPIMASYGNEVADIQYHFRRFIEGLVANYRRASGKPRWAEKTPTNVDVMVPLGEIFPDAQFIHVLRDGRDVTCSLVTMDWINLATGRKASMVENMTGAARYWRDTITAARQRAALPSLAGRVLEVRYEDLVTNTPATMRQVLAFLGETWDNAVLAHHRTDRRSEPAESSTAQAAKPITHSALGRWRRDMTEQDKAEFKAEAGALLTELGYAGTQW